MNDDELMARLRAADPAHGVDATNPADSWVDDLAEATMNTDVTSDNEHGTDLQAARRKRRGTWVIGVTAAAVLAAVAVGVFVGRGGDTPTPPTAQPAKVMTLGLPPSDAMGMCIQFSVDALKPMEVALSGTATAVEADAVTITPDRWYKGGDGSSAVKLTTQGDSVILEGGIALEKGKRYLITATGGQVNGCGFSSVWTADMAAAYAEAFGG